MQTEASRAAIAEFKTTPPLHGLWGVRHVRSLSVGVKLWLATAILAMPLVGLGIFYVNSLSSTVLFTSTEQRGADLFRPLAQAARDISTLAEIRTGVTTGDTDPSARIDANFALLRDLDKEHGNAATHGQLQDLQRRWQGFKAANASSAPEVLAAHGEVIDAAFALKGQIGADWLLILDPELAAYNLIDVSFTKLPDAQRYLGEIRMRLQAEGADGVYEPSESYAIAELVALLRDRLIAARDEIQGAAAAARDRPELLKQIEALPRGWDRAALDWLIQISKELSSGRPVPERLHALEAAATSVSSSFDNVQDQVQQAADTALSLRYAIQFRSAVLALTGSAIAMVLAMFLMLALARRISRAITRLLRISVQIADGHYDNEIEERGHDEISKLFDGMAVMQSKLAAQIMAERKQLVTTSRIQAALENVSGCVMVADACGEIIYTNRAMDDLLRRSEEQIRRHVPAFSAGDVIGSSLEDMRLNARQADEITLGNLVFRLTENAVVTPHGECVGTVIEWADRTTELSMERETEQMLSGVLQGNLTRRIDVAGKPGFFGTLGRGMNQLADNIHQIVLTTKAAAGEVRNGADEISQGTTHLSQRTEAQAASLEKTSASMAQMTLTVTQNADCARQADLLATAACDQAQKGGRIVGQTVHAMHEISESSKQVASIIGVIDEIAFQTNLLALNAAVEAARAGEQGRGFAVVASEVRSLAGRSAAAAKQIKDLIRDSVTKVSDGSSLVSQSGQTLEQIVIAVKKVNDMVATISMASQEQTSAIEQVNRAVREMDDMTHQNAALVEQATAASHAMAQQAHELIQLMECYQTGMAADKAGDVLETAPQARVA